MLYTEVSPRLTSIPVRPIKRVCVLGMAESSRHLAPFDDLSIPIWVINESYRHAGGDGKPWLKRWDRLFQMHKTFDYRRPNNQNDPKHWEWLREQPGPGEAGFKPIYMQEVDPEVPASVKYPKDEIVARFLPDYRRIVDGGEEQIEYFGSSVEYMLALALYEDYDEIQIWGVEMASNTEYRDQRASGSFWLGVAGQHAKLVLPANCSLLKGPLYGYGQVPKLNRMQLEVRIKGMFAEYQKYEAKRSELAADLLTAQKELVTFKADAQRVKAIKMRLGEDEKQSDALAGRMNILRGHIDEAQFIIDTLDALLPVTGGQTQDE